METISEFSPIGEDEMVKARGMLKYILNYVVVGRLEDIKDALPASERNRVKGKGELITAAKTPERLLAYALTVNGL